MPHPSAVSEQLAQMQGRIESRRRPSSPEHLYTREQVDHAFGRTFEAFTKAYEGGHLSEAQERGYRVTLEASQKAKKNGVVVNRFQGENGKNYHFKEGIPAEYLIDFQEQRIAEEKRRGRKADKEEIARQEEDLQVLRESSRPFFYGLQHTSPSRIVARVKHEAERIQATGEDTGDPTKNYELAHKKLNERLELQFPPEKQPEPLPQPIIVTPDDVEALGDKAGKGGEDIPEIRQDKITLTIVRHEENIRKKALEEAETQLHAEMNRGSWFNPLNWMRKIALHAGEEYFRQRMQQRAYAAKLANNNSNLDMDLIRRTIRNANFQRPQEEAERQQAVLSVKEQVLAGINLEGRRLGTEIQDAQAAVRAMLINEVIRPVVSGAIVNEPQLQQRLREFVVAHQGDAQVRSVFGRDVSRFGMLAESFATDILESAEVIRNDLRVHHYSLDQIDRVVNIQLANISWAGEGEAKFNRTSDRFIAWAEHRKLTAAILNPIVVGAAFSLGALAFNRVTGTIGGAAARAVPLVGLLPGAAFAAFRRNFDLKRDIATHRAEMTYGGTHVTEASVNAQLATLTGRGGEFRRRFARQLGAYRRSDLEQFAYNTASARELVEGGGTELLTGTARESLNDLMGRNLVTDAVSQEALLRRRAEIQARLDYSSRERLDLVTFENRQSVQRERRLLIQALAASTIAMRRQGINQNYIDTRTTALAGDWNQRFIQNREEQDRLFNHYRLRNAAGSAITGGVVGLTMGFLLQEGAAAFQRGVWGNPVAPTAIEQGINAVSRTVSGHDVFMPVVSPEHLQEVYQHGGSIDLGSNFELREAAGDPQHALTLFNHATGQPIAGAPLLHQGPTGNIILPAGAMSSLPPDVQNSLSGWSQNGVTELFSVKAQVADALAHHKTETILAGHLKLVVDGAKNNVTVTDTTNPGVSLQGTIDATANLHLQGSDVNLNAVHNELAAQGYGTSSIVEITGAGINSLKHIKDLLATKGTEHLSSGNLNLDIDGRTGTATFTDTISHAKIGGTIDPSGQFHFDMSKSPDIKPDQFQKALSILGFKTNEASVPGGDALKHFKDNGMIEEAKRQFWHNNNTPRVYDGKELQLYEHALSDKSVDIDMSKMVSNQTLRGWTNWDGTIDNHYGSLASDIVTNKDGTRTYNNFVALITVNDAANKAHEVISVPIDASGHAKIPAGTDLGQLFKVENGKVVQLARFVEIAHEERSGSTVVGRSILATSVGHGLDKIGPIHLVNAIPPEAGKTFTVTPPLSIDMTPPMGGEIPVIPLVETPRHPLEPLPEPEPPVRVPEPPPVTEPPGKEPPEETEPPKRRRPPRHRRPPVEIPPEPPKGPKGKGPIEEEIIETQGVIPPEPSQYFEGNERPTETSSGIEGYVTRILDGENPDEVLRGVDSSKRQEILAEVNIRRAEHGGARAPVAPSSTGETPPVGREVNVSVDTDLANAVNSVEEAL